MDTQNTYTVTEAAFRLRVSGGRIYAMIKAGKIRATQIDGEYAIPITEVARVKQQRIAALEAKLAKYRK